jgi:hypothetical protein
MESIFPLQIEFLSIPNLKGILYLSKRFPCSTSAQSRKVLGETSLFHQIGESLLSPDVFFLFLIKAFFEASEFSHLFRPRVAAARVQN